MISKKEKILNTALKLFANEGYNATSTYKIAQQAGVSEGLIFKHFNNKQLLLKSIIEKGEEKFKDMLINILNEKDPRSAIFQLIELPFSIKKSEYNFWRLQFKLKWEQNYNNPKKMQPLIDKLEWAFTELKYKNPKFETQFLIQTFEAVSSGILKNNIANQLDFKAFLINKYAI